MDQKRIFVGVDITDEARRAAAAYIDDLRSNFSDVRVGWERPEKLHLTLKFVGDVPTSRISELSAAVAGVASRHRNFELSIDGTGVFPSTRKPRVLWLGVRDETSSLTRIQSEIETEFEKLGIEKENRKYSPHLTIARIREPERSRDLAEEHAAASFAPVTFRVPAIVVFESKLQPSGSIYSKVAEKSLADS